MQKNAMTNFIVNGDFSTPSTSGWAPSGSTLSANNGYLQMTSTGAYSYCQTWYNFNFVNNHSYYISFDLSVSSATDITQIIPRWMFNNGSSATSIGSQIINYSTSFQHYSYINVLSSGSYTSVGINFLIYGASGSYLNLDNIVVIDLTAAFGAGNEPDKAYMDALLARLFPSTNGWFDGTDTTVIDSQYLENWANPLFVTGLGTSSNSLTYTINGVASSLTVPYATNAMYGTDSSGQSDERAISYEYLHKPAGTNVTTETYAAYVPEQSADAMTYSITTTVSSSSTDSQLPTAKSVWTLSQNIGNLTLVTYDGSPTVSSAYPYFVVADNSTGAQQLKTVSFATMKTMPYFIPWGTVYGNGGNNLAAGNGSVAGTSGQNYSGSTAVGVTAQATNSNATAIGASSTASNFEAVAIGIISQATAPYSSAIGSGSVVTNDQSIALGANSLCKVNSWLSIDTTSVNRAYTAYSTDYVFFRNAAVSTSITTQAGYTTGYTLTQALEGAALLLNGTAELTTRDEKTTLTNLLVITASSQTINGVTITRNADGSWLADGTATANIRLVIGTAYLTVNHRYYLGKAPGSPANLFCDFLGQASESVILKYSGTSSLNQNVKISINSGVTVSSVLYWPEVIDLTAAFGADLEPTAAEMDVILLRLFPDTNGWFDGSDTRLIDSQWLLTGAHTWTAAQNLGTGTTVNGATIVTSSTISYDSSTQTLTLF
jgi:hypothetical protein